MAPRVVEIYLIGGHGSFKEHEGGRVRTPKDMTEEVKAVFVGGCVTTGLGRISETNKRSQAHAHTSGAHKGWVCFQLPEYLKDKSLRMHQLAHIQAGEVGHTKKWREAMAKLGQEVPRQHARICS